MKLVAILFLTFICSFSFAEALKVSEFENQYEEKTKVDESTKWVIFSNDKDLSDVVKKTLDDLKLTDLQKSGGQYVADISGMPSLVTKMFALPKMREYSFKLALDKDGEATKPWPKKAGQITLMKLNKLEITETAYASNQEELTQFIKNQTAK